MIIMGNFNSLEFVIFISALFISRMQCLEILDDFQTMDFHHETNPSAVITTTDSLLFEFISKSRLHCAVQCAIDDSCQTFTFNIESRSCQGHMIKVRATGASTVVTPNTKIYQITKPCKF